MKHIVPVLLGLMLVCTFSACGQSDTQVSEGVLPVETPVETVSTSTVETSVATESIPPEERIGTRSNPYNFTDEISIVSQDRYSGGIVEYTLNLTEVWKGEKVATKFPNYVLNDRLLTRGQVVVNCDSTDDEIGLGLEVAYVTSSLNEERADIRTYKEGELNNYLDIVYSGGIYDIMILSSDDGVGALDISLLKIRYTDIEGNWANIWIEMPEDADEVIVTPAVEPENTDKLTETPVVEPENKITPEELDALLLEEPMYVESTEYIVQDERYKALYPDMLQAVVKNNSGTDVKNVVVAFVAWDKNNFPVKIYSSGVDIHGAYVKLCQYNDANMLNGTSYGSEGGLSIDEESGIATFKAIVVSYEDFDGNTWENPYYETWVELYSDKKLG